MKRGNGYTRGIIAVLAVIVIFLAGYIANDIRRDKIIKEVPESTGSEKEQVILTNDERLEAGSQAAASNEYIGEEKAKEIALNHAGVSEADAGFVKGKFEYDDGTAVYEIEFYSGKTEYEYKINAVSGEIIEYDVDNN